MSSCVFRHPGDRHAWHEPVCPLEAGHRIQTAGQTWTTQAGRIPCIRSGTPQVPEGLEA